MKTELLPELDMLYSHLKKGENNFKHSQVRDLTKIGLGNGYSLIVAVDSDGGIGSRPGDFVKTDDYLVGRFAMRVPLLEILASGALPLAAFDTLTLPMDDHGLKIIKGIKDELMEAGLGKDFPLSGSTEDNVPTKETGIGTMVIGIVHDRDFRPGTGVAGDVVVCLGIPKSAPGDKVTIDDAQIVKLKEIRQISEKSDIHDILPVGSHGVLYEAMKMADSAGLNFRVLENSGIDLKKSGGPGTCIILSCKEMMGKALRKLTGAPVTKIGQLEKRSI